MSFAEEAKEWTSGKVNRKVVEVKLLQKDQYNRVVGKVTTTGTIPPIDLSVGLVHNGYATLYQGKGAEYDGNREILRKEITHAQGNRLGIWSNGVENAQTPAEYKRLMKAKAKAAATASQ
jgi:endonuclease YncB( thermonuclease family)